LLIITIMSSLDSSLLNSSDSTSPDLQETSLSNTNDSLDLESIGLQEIGFLLDSGLPHRLQVVDFVTPATDRKIRVALSVIDDTPGAVQSGHYLWPAANHLADYIVQSETDWALLQSESARSLLELGAGCGLAALTAHQVGLKSLQCIVVTDHDPSVLARARDNHETTLEHIMESLTDEALDKAINSLASIPFCFKEYVWGEPVDDLIEELQEHTSPSCSTFDMVLGSDLIYDVEVIEPLLSSAAQVMAVETSRFWLSQSFAYGDDAEAEMDRVCDKLGLQRKILKEGPDAMRIQEFRRVR
jgi:predicted nicotinamide N-methyase